MCFWWMLIIQKKPKKQTNKQANKKTGLTASLVKASLK